MGRIIRKYITDELLELKENFLPKRFGGDNDDGHRNDNPANRDPCLIRRSVVGHIEQTERLLIQSPVQSFQIKRQKPNEGFARRAAENPSGAGLKRLNMPVEPTGGSG